MGVVNADKSLTTLVQSEIMQNFFTFLRLTKYLAISHTHDSCGNKLCNDDDWLQLDRSL